MTDSGRRRQIGLVTAAAFVYLVAPERVTTGAAFAAQAGEALFGPAGALIFTCVGVLLLGLPVYYLVFRREVRGEFEGGAE